jgi:hypothetical protein
VKDLYNENYKPLKKNQRKLQKMESFAHVHGLAKSIL